MSVPRVSESAVIEAPLEAVWNAVRPLDFKFWSIVKGSALEDGKSVSEVGSVRKITFKVRMLPDVFLARWHRPESEAGGTVWYGRCGGHLNNSTFVEWSGDYSSDAGQGEFCATNILKAFPCANVPLITIGVVPSSASCHPRFTLQKDRRPQGPREGGLQITNASYQCADVAARPPLVCLFFFFFTVSEHLNAQTKTRQNTGRKNEKKSDWLEFRLLPRCHLRPPAREVAAWSVCRWARRNKSPSQRWEHRLRVGDRPPLSAVWQINFGCACAFAEKSPAADLRALGDGASTDSLKPGGFDLQPIDGIGMRQVGVVLFIAADRGAMRAVLVIAVVCCCFVQTRRPETHGSGLNRTFLKKSGGRINAACSGLDALPFPNSPIWGPAGQLPQQSQKAGPREGQLLPPPPPSTSTTTPHNSGQLQTDQTHSANISSLGYPPSAAREILTPH
ncbi:MAG: hypothetical protein BJ554DRAFT_5353 [Olpidium bornovanus]|uniref:Uncharacterized protein n=1 Tax=Olpidium bornovanus TaxID=278681 RepID=A0A8H8DL48_9FUNG|nr:MAG: hypothetical protein BJ554DRAFT_5353 [Olpidium bornovanus]